MEFRLVHMVVAELMAVCKGPHSLAPLQQALLRIVQEARHVSREELDEALEQMVPLMTEPDPITALIALGCAGLVELGGKAEIVSPPILQRTRETLAMALIFAKACQDEARQATGGQVRREIDENIQRYGQQVAKRLPEGERAWNALPIICHAANTVLMRLPDARAALRRDNAFMTALKICPLKDPAITYMRDVVLVQETTSV